MDEHKKYLIICYCSAIAAMVAFAGYACVRYTLWLIQQKHDQSQEEFNTARGTQGPWRITWSLFAGAVGCWVLVSPPIFAVYNGILGLVLYSLASGLPLLLIAFFGTIVQGMHHDCLSLGDFVDKRFGPTLKTWVASITLFNMSIAMLAELTTIGAIFRDFLGSVNYPIVIIVVVLTMAYTAFGGLRISIITDQLQALLALTLLSILVVYVAVTFRHPLPESAIEPGSYLGPNEFGYSAIFSMPCSLVAATVFSEAVWQKVWASQNRRALLIGGSCASAITMVVVFLFGFGGWLAAWAGLIDLTYTNPNLYLFQVFASEAAPVSGDAATDYQNASAQVSSWVGVLVLVLAATMNEGAIDSLQTGITATISAHFLRGQHIVWARLVVVLINIPIIIIALSNYNVLSLFLITNMLTTCCFLPVVAGLWDATRRWTSESAALFGCIFAMLASTAYGALRWKSISYGAWYAWYGNVNYWYDYFLVASISSVVGVALWTLCALAIQRLTGWEGPGVTGVLQRVPGFRYVTGGYHSVDWLTLPYLRRFGALMRHDPSIEAISGAPPSEVQVKFVDADQGPYASATPKGAYIKTVDDDKA